MPRRDSGDSARNGPPSTLPNPSAKVEAIERSVARISEIAARALQVERVGLWFYTEEQAALRRMYLYLRPAGVHLKGGVLRADTFPSYFDALAPGEPVVVNDARTDPRAVELLPVYAKPLEVLAWIDQPIRMDGATVGWARFESVGGPREWSDDALRIAAHVTGLMAEVLEGEWAPLIKSSLTQGLERVIIEGLLSVLLLDRRGLIQEANDAFASLVGLDTAAHARGRALRDFVAPGASPERFEEAVAAGRRVTREELHLVDADGSDVWTLASVLPVPDVADREEPGVMVTLVDITHRKSLEQELQRQAHNDPLTGLANRRLLWEKAGQALALADRHDRDAAVLYVDLAGFKQINDRYGHAAGDAVLVRVAERLTGVLRESDVAARIGGDEFAVLLAEVEGQTGAVEAARRILRAIAAPVEVDSETIEVAARVGVALYPDQGSGLEELLENADAAMYRARERAETGVELFRGGPGPEEERAEANTTGVATGEDAGELAHTFDPGQLLLHYQPVIGLSKGEIVGAEALVRWQHPELGLLEASDFLFAAVEAGMMGLIDRWTVEHAVDQLAWWTRTHPDVWIAVNLSAASLQDPGFVGFVRDELERADVAPNRFMVEVTEADVHADREAAIRVLSGLRELGVRVAMDRWSTSAAARAALRRLPADVVKVDLDFVKRAEYELDDPELQAALNELVGEGPVRLVAERIETFQEFEWAARSPFTYGQGYFFGFPVPAEEISLTGEEGEPP